MKRSIIFTIAILVLLLFVTYPAQAGGWAVVTLEELPTQVIAGEPLTVEFAVRQHGATLTSNFGTPAVYATHVETGEKFSVDAEKTSRTGYFTAKLLFPQSGTWNWSISVFNDPQMGQNMPPLTVMESGNTPLSSQAPPVSMPLVLGMIGLMTVFGAGVVFFASRTRWAWGIGFAGVALLFIGLAGVVQQPAAAATAQPPSIEVSPVELGKALFIAKGCVVCHMQAEGRVGFSGIQTDIGPNLTNTQLPADYIRVWLKDPLAIKPETQMPNLDLKETEIEALAAFLTAGQ